MHEYSSLTSDRTAFRLNCIYLNSEVVDSVELELELSLLSGILFGEWQDGDVVRVDLAFSLFRG